MTIQYSRYPPVIIQKLIAKPLIIHMCVCMCIYSYKMTAEPGFVLTLLANNTWDIEI